MLTSKFSPTSVQPKEDSKKALENGHPPPELDESGNPKGERVYTKYYQQHEQPVGPVSLECMIS